MFDPLCSCLAEPAAMLPAVGAAKFTGMWFFAGADDADIAAAGPLAIGGAVELDLEANEAAVGSRPSHGGAEHLDLRSHADLPCAVSAGSGTILIVSAGSRRPSLTVRRAPAPIERARRHKVVPR